MTEQPFELRLRAAYDAFASEALEEVDAVALAALVKQTSPRPRFALPHFGLARPSWVGVALAALLLILAASAMAVVGSMLLERARDFRGVVGPGPDMSVARDRPVVVALSDGRVMIAGGQLAASTDPISAEIFDPRSERYSSFSGDIPTGSGSGLLLPDGRVLIRVFDPSRSSAGYGGIYLLDPESMTSRFVSLPAVPNDLTAVIGQPLGKEPAIALLQSGSVLIVGDAAGTAVPSKAFVFDPTAELLTQVGSLSEPRIHPSITTLNDGRVLVAGGISATAPASLYFQEDGRLSDAELYDPNTRQFTSVGTMPSVRGNAQSFLLPDGLVMIEQAGDNTTRFGEDQGPVALDMFDPVSLTFTMLDPGAWPGPPTVTQLADGRLLLTGMASGTSWAATYDVLTGTRSELTPPRAIFPQGATTTDGTVVLAGGFTDPPLTLGNPAVPWTDVVR
jgi:hypothetical protein